MSTLPCPRRRPHGSHVWVRETASPVFGALRVEYLCPGKVAR